MISSRRLNALCAAFIFLLNAFISRRLFTTEFLPHMFSIEGAYIALTRWVMAHPFDLAWFPLWNAGEPFQNTYQPGLPILSAIAGKLLHTDSALAYHVTIAALYCLGPVGIFFLAFHLTHRRDVAILAALLFSLLSPSAFLVPEIRADLGSLFHPRRYQDLVFYGEGPNVSGLSLVPFGLLAVHAVFQRFTPVRLLLGAMLLGLIVLISWPATVALAMGVVAYLLSRDWLDLRRRIWRILVLAVAAYLLIAPLDTPATILINQRNSQMISGVYRYTPAHILYFGLLLFALIASRFLFRRFHAHRFTEFSFYCFLIPGSITLSAYRFHTALIPQPERFHLAMEIGASLLIASLAAKLLNTRSAIWIPVAILVPLQAHVYSRFAGNITKSIDIASTYEFQVTEWLQSNLPGQRVFAAGSLGFWMNAWTDQPQVTGCCAPGQPNPMSWIVPYTIAHGTEKQAESAILWLRAFGAQAVIVGGPNTRNSYHDWGQPAKFEGVLPKIWEQGDDRIYRVPSRTASLAHIVHADEVVARAPVYGPDVEPLRPLIQALEDPARPVASWQWLTPHSARIQADLQPGDLLFIQETWLPGWRAAVTGHKNSAPIEVSSDALGMLILRPHRSGPTQIDLTFDGGPPTRILQALCLACWLILIAWIVRDASHTRATLD